MVRASAMREDAKFTALDNKIDKLTDALKTHRERNDAALANLIKETRDELQDVKNRQTRLATAGTPRRFGT